MTWLPPAVAPIVLLLCSNVFMTFAWYGHLKYKQSALWKAILVSWGIAFFEYCLQVRSVGSVAESALPFAASKLPKYSMPPSRTNGLTT